MTPQAMPDAPAAMLSLSTTTMSPPSPSPRDFRSRARFQAVASPCIPAPITTYGTDERSVIETVKYNDLASGIGKTFFFGFAIALVACYNGLRTSGGADGVGRATTATVVTGAITVLIMDFFLTKLFLMNF